VESTGVLADGTVYIGASDLRRITALDPADGHVIWRTDVFGWSWGTPLVEADRIVVGTAGGRPYFCRHVAGLCVLDRATGRLVARRPLPEVPGAHQWGVARSIVRAADLVVAATIEGGVFGYPIP
jgi:outer membrane protein assembly factor BamB